jgi:hypothetical protein
MEARLTALLDWQRDLSPGARPLLLSFRGRGRYPNVIQMDTVVDRFGYTDPPPGLSECLSLFAGSSLFLQARDFSTIPLHPTEEGSTPPTGIGVATPPTIESTICRLQAEGHSFRHTKWWERTGEGLWIPNWCLLVCWLES